MSTWLGALPDAELDRLGEALAGGRLSAVTSPSLLRAYGWPEGWMTALELLRQKGWPTGVLAELVATARLERQQVRRRRIDVVCTRPDNARVEVLDTSVAVRRLFTQATQEVVIAGFRVTERDMLEPLRRRTASSLDVRLFVDIDPAVTATGGKQPVPSDLTLWPAAWWRQFIEGVWPQYLDPPRAWFAPSTLALASRGDWRSMHIKSVVVDRRFWFVTSANFTNRGHNRNMEMGALIEDPDRASEVVAVFDEWVGAGVFKAVPTA